ncbi:MAG TPA: iron ABC transporter substrate-binding protein [Acidimicrobiaceae bacterium]|nr:iron ABC transporter substrate-binding protein [Acidimicrobiaceae bacterium]HCB37895.1 iron ABC transporter substrate-binding protein [Acidimicrobiaceae bacterium]
MPTIKLSRPRTLARHTPAAFAVALVVLVSSCAGTGTDAGTLIDTPRVCAERTGERLTVYSGRSENLMAPVLDAWECTTGNAVDVRWGGSTDLALLAGEEGDSGGADVFLSRSPGPVGFLQGRGLLRPLDRAVLDLVGPQYRSATGHWAGFTGRKRVLVYNVDAAAADAAAGVALPGSVFDLTSERYRGRVAVPATNGSFVDWFTVLRDAHGDEAATRWINEMVANDARYYPNNRSIVDAVSRGEIDFGLVNHYYNYQEAEANGDAHRAANHEFADDDIGALLIVTAAAVTSFSDDVGIANDLVAYLLSEPAQRFFTDSSLEYPLAAGVEPNAALPPTTAGAVGSIGFDDLGAGFEETNAVIEASGILLQ